MSVAPMFCEAEPFASADLIVGQEGRSVWDVMPEAARLKAQVDGSGGERRIQDDLARQDNRRP